MASSGALGPVSSTVRLSERWASPKASPSFAVTSTNTSWPLSNHRAPSRVSRDTPISTPSTNQLTVRDTASPSTSLLHTVALISSLLLMLLGESVISSATAAALSIPTLALALTSREPSLATTVTSQSWPLTVSPESSISLSPHATMRKTQVT